MNPIKTGELCELAGVTARTIRHYLAEDLIKPIDTTEGGRNSYSLETARAIRAIKILQETGMSLKQIKNLFDSTNSPAPSGKYLTSHLRAAVTDISESLAQRIGDLQEAHRRVMEVVGETARCDACPGAKCALCPSLGRLRTLGLFKSESASEQNKGSGRNT